MAGGTRWADLMNACIKVKIKRFFKEEITAPSNPDLPSTPGSPFSPFSPLSPFNPKF